MAWQTNGGQQVQNLTVLEVLKGFDGRLAGLCEEICHIKLVDGSCNCFMLFHLGIGEVLRMVRIHAVVAR